MINKMADINHVIIVRKKDKTVWFAFVVYNTILVPFS